MVDDTGIEPVTPSMSTKCSTAELIIHYGHGPDTPIRKWGAPEPHRPRAIKGVAQVIKGFWLSPELRYVFCGGGDIYAR